mmetsp:Transcript_22517/g.49745  ORF Transcript_22517/g.49745 Transcript_22517/m.49745 type:complete len:196 (-) Transcript_22517:169-756(-)
MIGDHKAVNMQEEIIRAEMRHFRACRRPLPRSAPRQQEMQHSASLPAVSSRASPTHILNDTAPWLGDDVCITGMRHRQELNGAEAKVVRSLPDEHGRLCIRLKDESKVLRVHMDRLKPPSSDQDSQSRRRGTTKPRASEAVWLLGLPKHLIDHRGDGRAASELAAGRQPATSGTVGVRRSYSRKPMGGFFRDVEV